jgi:hypothetical protein
MIEQRGFMQNANAMELVKRVAIFAKAFDVVLHFMRGTVLSTKPFIKRPNQTC